MVKCPHELLKGTSYLCVVSFRTGDIGSAAASAKSNQAQSLSADVAAASGRAGEQVQFLCTQPFVQNLIHGALYHVFPKGCLCS